MPTDPAFAFSDAKFFIKLASTLVIMYIIARVAGEVKALNGIPRKKMPLSPSGTGVLSVLAGEGKGRLAGLSVLGGILS